MAGTTGVIRRYITFENPSRSKRFEMPGIKQIAAKPISTNGKTSIALPVFLPEISS